MPSPIAQQQPVALRGTEQRVLDFMIAYSRDNGGLVALYVREIAERTELHEDTVKRALRNLRSRNLLNRMKHISDARRYMYVVPKQVSGIAQS